MRRALTIALGLVVVVTATAQDKKAETPPARYGVTADLQTYPQVSAKQALASVAKALERKRVEYVLAHLANPDYVDETVQRLGGRFDELVREVATHLADNPKETQGFVRILKEGTVEETGTSAKATHKDVPGRQITLIQRDGRWFMNNENEGEKKKN
jgi:hypothetical protein